MTDQLIEFRWYMRQIELPNGLNVAEEGPKLQYRVKFSENADGEVVSHWEWSEWQDVGMHVETVQRDG
jgi:hypothetical protein